MVSSSRDFYGNSESAIRSRPSPRNRESAPVFDCHEIQTPPSTTSHRRQQIQSEKSSAGGNAGKNGSAFTWQVFFEKTLQCLKKRNFCLSFEKGKQQRSQGSKGRLVSRETADGLPPAFLSSRQTRLRKKKPKKTESFARRAKGRQWKGESIFDKTKVCNSAFLTKQARTRRKRGSNDDTSDPSTGRNRVSPDNRPVALAGVPMTARPRARRKRRTRRGKVPPQSARRHSRVRRAPINKKSGMRVATNGHKFN